MTAVTELPLVPSLRLPARIMVKDPQRAWYILRVINTTKIHFRQDTYKQMLVWFMWLDGSHWLISTRN